MSSNGDSQQQQQTIADSVRTLRDTLDEDEANEVLDFLLKEIQDNKEKEIFEAEGIDAVIDAMRQHADSIDVQLKSMEVLQKVAVESDETRDSIIVKGGLDAVTAAMKKHTDSKKLQLRSGDALCSILYFYNIKRADTVENLVTASIESLVGVLLLAMHRFEESAATSSSLLGALWNLLYFDDYSKEIKLVVQKNNGLSSILDAMKRHKDNAEVQRCAFGTLGNLCFGEGDAFVCDEIVSKGVLDEILVAMNRHVANEQVQEQSCRLLGNMSVKRDCRVFIACKKQEFIAATLQAMRKHGRQAENQEHALWFLGNLSKFVDQRNLLENGAIETVLAAMRRFPENKDVQISGCKVACELVDDVTARRMVMAKGGLNVIVSAMTKNADVSTIQLMGCKCLSKILEESDEDDDNDGVLNQEEFESTKDDLIDMGVVEFIQVSRQEHEGNYKVKAAVDEVLHLLNAAAADEQQVVPVVSDEEDAPEPDAAAQ